MKNIMLIATLLVLLGACSTADTTGDMYERTYRAPIDIEAGGAVTVLVYLSASSANETETSQSPTNSATTSTDGKLSASEGGATSTIGGLVRDVVNTLSAPVLEKKPKVPEVTLDPEVILEPGVYKEPISYSIGPMHGVPGKKHYTWLRWKYTDNITGPIKFVFPSCNEELVVPDPSVPYGEDGNLENHNQMYYFPGGPNQKDTNNGYASIIASPTCTGTTVDVYRN